MMHLKTRIAPCLLGSDSDLDANQRKVRFAPINRHHQLGAARPRNATRRHSDGL